MVDVSGKSSTSRSATARGRIYIPRAAYELLAPDSVNLGSGSPSESDTTALDKAKAKARAKGDVLTVAQLAAIMACKRTSELIPLCHPLPLTHVSVDLSPQVHSPEDTGSSGDIRCVIDVVYKYSVLCTATVRCNGQTGVEMEALTAVSVGLLTVWDMLKAVAGKEMVISDLMVSHKSGGKSGDFVRSG
jgi:molybdenum cofactor biosynthesis enzyme